MSNGKRLPGFALPEKDERPQLSLATGGVQKAVASQTPGSVETVKLAGQLKICGSSLSFTVTINEQPAVFWALSVAV